jgi:hypothetical protein
MTKQEWKEAAASGGPDRRKADSSLTGGQNCDTITFAKICMSQERGQTGRKSLKDDCMLFA